MRIRRFIAICAALFVTAACAEESREEVRDDLGVTVTTTYTCNPETNQRTEMRVTAASDGSRQTVTLLVSSDTAEGITNDVPHPIDAKVTVNLAIIEADDHANVIRVEDEAGGEVEVAEFGPSDHECEEGDSGK